MSKKVLVAMSGGVDSSVACALLSEQGYDVEGIFVEAYNEPGCRTDDDKKDALQVALHLGIRFQTLDLRSEYKERVVKYFLDEYERGRTPNPDIVCNREVKFGLLYNWMIEHGYEYLATGHYARIASGRLQRARDESKDQSYFLWQVAHDILDHIIFPLGEMTKAEVREKARLLKLPNATKPDSMGVCMIGELNVRSFLRDKLGTKLGQVYWKDELVGTHEGLWFYTVGARGGWSISPSVQSSEMPALYVIGKDVDRNDLFVGEREQVMTNQFGVSNLEYRIPAKNEKLWARIRNLGELTLVESIDRNRVTLVDPVFAPSPGQSVVLYDEQGIIVGGGIIANS